MDFRLASPIGPKPICLCIPFCQVSASPVEPCPIHPSLHLCFETVEGKTWVPLSCMMSIHNLSTSKSHLVYLLGWWVIGLVVTMAGGLWFQEAGHKHPSTRLEVWENKSTWDKECIQHLALRCQFLTINWLLQFWDSEDYHPSPP